MFLRGVINDCASRFPIIRFYACVTAAAVSDNMSPSVLNEDDAHFFEQEAQMKPYLLIRRPCWRARKPIQSERTPPLVYTYVGLLFIE